MDRFLTRVCNGSTLISSSMQCQMSKMSLCLWLSTVIVKCNCQMGLSNVTVKCHRPLSNFTVKCLHCQMWFLNVTVKCDCYVKCHCQKWFKMLKCDYQMWCQMWLSNVIVKIKCLCKMSMSLSNVMHCRMPLSNVIIKCHCQMSLSNDKCHRYVLSLLVLCRVLFWIWSPEFAHSPRSNFTDDLEYNNINNVSHFRRDSRVRDAVKVRWPW